MVRMLIPEALARLAEREPDAVAVRCGDAVITRAELGRLASEAAAGIAPGTVAPVSRANSIDFVVETLAAWTAGATPLPLSPRLPAEERDAILALAAQPGAAQGSWRLATSSGSTGRPKLIRAAGDQSIDPDEAIAPFVPRAAVQLVAGPLFHAAPFTYAMRGLMTGHELVLMERFDAATWLRLIETHEVTWGMLVPTMMRRIAALCEAEDAWPALPSLRAILHLGARCPADLKRRWIDWLGPGRVHELYAGTESAGLAFIDGREWLAHPGSVGRPVGDSEFRIVDGEIWMRRSRPTYAYLGAPARERDGWHSLGDAGWIDDEGYLYVADRLDDVINCGGVKIHPADVEGVLDAHPRVRSSVAVGRPHPDLGEVVHAVVDGDATLAELRAWVEPRLDPEKWPRSWQLVDVELRGDTGKVRRSAWR
ncbi:MAG: AMP-binding protein [Nocardioides sp.]|uniref:AMP-binding protein n=1 Tax=Nocardioides sp. TaxID=35761 RepID=UPI0039E46DC5